MHYKTLYKTRTNKKIHKKFQRKIPNKKRNSNCTSKNKDICKNKKNVQNKFIRPFKAKSLTHSNNQILTTSQSFQEVLSQTLEIFYC